MVKITIGSEVIEIDLDEETKIGDLDENMDEVASQIAYYGELLGAAKEEEGKLDAAYRRWRGGISSAMLKKDPKIAEWKVKAAIEEQKSFEQYKTAQAACTRNIVTIDILIKALCEKSPNLRSKGARMRAVLDSQGMTTPSEDKRNLSASRKQSLRGGKKNQ